MKGCKCVSSPCCLQSDVRKAEWGTPAATCKPKDSQCSPLDSETFFGMRPCRRTLAARESTGPPSLKAPLDHGPITGQTSSAARKKVSLSSELARPRLSTRPGLPKQAPWQNPASENENRRFSWFIYTLLEGPGSRAIPPPKEDCESGLWTYKGPVR